MKIDLKLLTECLSFKHKIDNIEIYKISIIENDFIRYSLDENDVNFNLIPYVMSMKEFEIISRKIKIKKLKKQ